MYYLKLGDHGAGFTNQIFALITGLMIAHNHNHEIVIVDDFLNDFNKSKYTPINNIFDIQKLNTFLKNYNIIVIDKNNINFEILSAIYGYEIMNVDLTEFMKQQYIDTNKLFIKNHTYNDIQGDPCPGQTKTFNIKYKINEYCVEERYNENSDFVIDFDGPYNLTFGWINSYNDNMFEKILTNIEYHEDFVKNSEDIHGKINVIHLRVEDDAITHWSKGNNMSKPEFQRLLEEKYIEIIRRYIYKNDETIILSSSLNNGVIDFLNEHKYNYRFTEKKYDDREKNAIIDFLVSKNCNNIFIGNFNMKTLNGSTFSYYISKMIKCKVKILIDLSNIHDEEVISFKLNLN